MLNLQVIHALLHILNQTDLLNLWINIKLHEFKKRTLLIMNEDTMNACQQKSKRINKDSSKKLEMQCIINKVEIN
jgi:hypothetical protein